MRARFTPIDDKRLFFEASIPVEVGNWIRINDVDYAMQTAEKHCYRERIIKKKLQ